MLEYFQLRQHCSMPYYISWIFFGISLSRIEFLCVGYLYYFSYYCSLFIYFCIVSLGIHSLILWAYVHIMWIYPFTWRIKKKANFFHAPMPLLVLCYDFLFTMTWHFVVCKIAFYNFRPLLNNTNTSLENYKIAGLSLIAKDWLRQSLLMSYDM